MVIDQNIRPISAQEDEAVAKFDTARDHVERLVQSLSATADEARRQELDAELALAEVQMFRYAEEAQREQKDRLDSPVARAKACVSFCMEMANRIAVAAASERSWDESVHEIILDARHAIEFYAPSRLHDDRIKALVTVARLVNSLVETNDLAHVTERGRRDLSHLADLANAIGAEGNTIDTRLMAAAEFRAAADAAFKGRLSTSKQA